MSRSPTPRLLLGLAITLLAVGIFSWYALWQIHGLRELQSDTIDRNRRDSLQLLRIQNNLNQLAVAMRDMLEGEGGYPLEAWHTEFQRLRDDLRDAVTTESKLTARPQEQQQYLSELLRQFWSSSEEVFAIARNGDKARARKIIANSLQAQQAALSATVARQLVQNNDAEEQAAARIQKTYSGVARTTYVFVAAVLLTISLTLLSVIYLNRRIFEQIQFLSNQRRTLAQRLFTVQEDVLRSISRELHDDFGQILTAIGVMLNRADKKHVPAASPLHDDLMEVREIVQDQLERIRSLSQALHPTVLDDYGLEQAMQRFLPMFEKQTGIHVRFQKEGSGDVPEEKAIHIYRVFQEALNNIAKHSKSTDAEVRMRIAADNLLLEVEDHGVGIGGQPRNGLGLIAMRERAELLHGSLSLQKPASATGTLVRLAIPI